MKHRINLYKSIQNTVVSLDQGMEKQYMPKVKIIGQILRLSAHVISEAFDGVKGKAYIEGIRHAMVEELDACPVPLSSWRDVATRLKGRESVSFVE